MCIVWLVGGVGMLALGGFIALIAGRWTRRTGGIALFGTGVLLLLAHPVLNMHLFGHIAQERLMSELDRVQRMQLTGCPPAQVEAFLGSPNRIEMANGRTNWHYSPGPWYAYQFDDIAVSFESGVVSSVWIDCF